MSKQKDRKENEENNNKETKQLPTVWYSLLTDS